MFVVNSKTLKMYRREGKFSGRSECDPDPSEKKEGVLGIFQ